MGDRENALTVQEFRRLQELHGYNSLATKPPKRGDYNVMFRWVFSAAPIYRSFNGENWVSRHDGVLRFSTYDEESEGFYNPRYCSEYGSHNPEVLLSDELPLKYDLQSRLERYKKSKLRPIVSREES